MSSSHERFLSQCFALAEQAASKGNHPFGALLVKDGVILLAAENVVVTETDVTGHAELQAVRRASRELSPETRSGATLYSSAEPCVMCCGAIYWAGIPLVVYGVAASTLSALTGEHFVIPSREIFNRLHPRVEVEGPIHESEGMRIHRTFWNQKSS